MPVAADHVKKERAPGVLESLDQLRADRKKVHHARPRLRGPRARPFCS